MSSQTPTRYQAAAVRRSHWNTALMAVLGLGFLVGAFVFWGTFPLRSSGFVLIAVQAGLCAWVTGRPPRPALARRMGLAAVWIAPFAAGLIITGMIIHL